MASSTTRLFGAWERALPLSPARRALELLAVSAPDMPRSTLESMTIGQRDSALMTLREAAFGSKITAMSKCSACDKRVEVCFDLDAIRCLPGYRLQSVPEGGRIERSGWSAAYRVPDSSDLFQIESCASEQQARVLLFQRCLSDVVLGGKQVAAGDLPESAFDDLSRELEQADPLADVELSLACPDCGNAWKQDFDILSFFWAELDAWARRLLSDVHVLASTYGWTEEQTLSLSPLRRRAYLEMVMA